jgi:selenide, water dikinase
MIMSTESIRLTQFAHGAGCGCKISPSSLKEILQGQDDMSAFKDLLIGNSESDDAAVLDLHNGTALISTTDFFMPIVDDAFDFGAIAAANSLSDVYAMGGKPVMAIAILGWPIEKLPAALASKVLEGARSICEQAGIPLAGGHTIDAKEPFFGLAVNGLVQTDQIKRNIGAQAGDKIYLTKPIGSGIITTAARRDLDTEHALELAIQQMKKLNVVGAKLSKFEGVHAITDVSGFGLLGHLYEMTGNQNVSAYIHYHMIPRLNGVQKYLDLFIYPDMTTKTYSWLSDKVSDLSGEQLLLLCDPQTSGGLLIAVSPVDSEAVEQILVENKCYHQSIGYFDEFDGKAIFVKDSNHA